MNRLDVVFDAAGVVRRAGAEQTLHRILGRGVQEAGALTIGAAHLQRLEVQVGHRGANHHGRLDLEESLVVQEPPQLGDDARPCAEDLAHLGVHREIGVALSIPRLRVGKTRVDGADSGGRVHLDLAEG